MNSKQNKMTKDSSRSNKPKREKRRARWRDELYVIIFEADTRAGQLFDVVLLIAILLSITVISLETVEYFEKSDFWRLILRRVEWTLTLLFTAEYLARLICVRRPLRYAISFFGIMDLVACLPMYLTLLNVDSKSFVIIRSIRLLRVFRVLKMMRMLREAHELKAAIWNSRDKIIVFVAVVMVAVTISGTIMYHVEHVELEPQASGTGDPANGAQRQTGEGDAASGAAENSQPTGVASAESETIDRGNMGRGKTDQFTSIPQSMYWAIVTMTTVGYGDIVPRTTVGKVISAALILLGYSLIIVPTGFVSAEIHAVQQQSGSLTSRSCPHCMQEGHHKDSKFCNMCGGPLVS